MPFTFATLFRLSKLVEQHTSPEQNAVQRFGELWDKCTEVLHRPIYDVSGNADDCLQQVADIEVCVSQSLCIALPIEI